MDRDRQEALLRGADKRVKTRTETLLKDPKVKDALRRNHAAVGKDKRPDGSRRARG